MAKTRYYVYMASFTITGKRINVPCQYHVEDLQEVRDIYIKQWGIKSPIYLSYVDFKIN